MIKLDNPLECSVFNSKEIQEIYPEKTYPKTPYVGILVPPKYSFGCLMAFSFEDPDDLKSRNQPCFGTIWSFSKDEVKYKLVNQLAPTLAKPLCLDIIDVGYMMINAYEFQGKDLWVEPAKLRKEFYSMPLLNERPEVRLFLELMMSKNIRADVMM